MKFYLFDPPVAKHLRKSRDYLEDAKVKRAEHQAAAERHGALTRLYAERISRLEAHLRNAVPARSHTDDSACGAHDGVLSAASLL